MLTARNITRIIVIGMTPEIIAVAKVLYQLHRTLTAAALRKTENLFHRLPGNLHIRFFCLRNLCNKFIDAGGIRQCCHIVMMPAVISDYIAILNKLPDEICFCFDIISGQKIGCLHIILFQDLRNLLDIGDIIATLIKGQINYFFFRSLIIGIVFSLTAFHPWHLLSADDSLLLLNHHSSMVLS